MTRELAEHACVYCLRDQATEHNGGLCARCVPPLAVTRHQIAVNVRRTGEE